jgi:acyl-CoA thioesterase I
LRLAQVEIRNKIGPIQIIPTPQFIVKPLVKKSEGLNIMSVKFSIACGLFLISVSSATAAPVVALGASNTEGKGRGATPDGVPRSQAFPAQLEKLLNAQGCRIRVQNAGVAGDTTSGMLRRLPASLAKDTKVLILQPGGNDARRGDGANTQDNIARIQSYAKERNVTVIMLDRLGSIAGSYRLPDGQHYSAEGHAAFAAYLAPQVMSSAACRG